jgi:hypothetical protein
MLVEELAKSNMPKGLPKKVKSSRSHDHYAHFMHAGLTILSRSLVSKPPASAKGNCLYWSMLHVATARGR